MTTIDARVSATLNISLDGLTAEQHALLEEEVERLVRRVLHPEDEQSELGWTRSTLDHLIKRLTDEGGRDQAVVLGEALKHDEGYVSRDRVYRICHYSGERTLRGFTKPVKRVVRAMQAEGLIPRDAVDPLEPRYQDDGGRADGFRVPLELVAVWRA